MMLLLPELGVLAALAFVKRTESPCKFHAQRQSACQMKATETTWSHPPVYVVEL